MTDSKATEKAVGSDYSLKEEIKSNKTGIFFTGHGKFSPELYISKDTGKKSFTDANNDDQSSKADMINNLLNVGLRLTRSLAIGFKFYRPSYVFKQKLSIRYSDSTTTTIDNEDDTSITGIGGGFNYLVQPNVYIGGYYTKIGHKTNFKTNENTGGVSNNMEGSDDFDLGQFGFGLGILKGNPGRGHRLELGYSRMEQPKEFKADAGEEIFMAAEFARNSITFGGNLKLRKNAYYDHIELMDFVIGEQVFSESYKPSVGGFISFGAGTGHTIGISGFVYETIGERDFFGQTQNAKIRVTQFALNYAYLF